MRTASRSDKDTTLERWTAVVLRSVHMAAVVWLGSQVVTGLPTAPAAAMLVLVSGLVMLALDLRAGRIALAELAGGFVLVKLALVGWMAWDPRQAPWLFWLLLIGSSVSSHAPKGFRHWPSRKPVKSDDQSRTSP